MDVDRKLREELRMDSQRLHEESVRSIRSGRSGLMDLNSKPPRRALDFKGSLDLTGLATSHRRCIRVGTRQIVDTGVKRDEHHFGDGFTSYAPMDIECQVDTLIGDQSIFAEEVKVRDAADPDAAMESSQDVTSMESVSEETSKHKNRIELSQVHQKWGKRGFHKVRFKFILHQRSKVAAEKVTKGGELFKLENSKSLNKGRSRNLTVRWYYYKARKRKHKFYGMGGGSNSFDGLINGKDEGAHFSKKKSLVETGKRCKTRFFGFGTPQETKTKNTRENKRSDELSPDQQKKGHGGFHKVRFKGRRHIRNAIYTGRVVLQNKLSVNWFYHKARKKELMVMNILVKALRQIDPKESDGRISLKLPEPFWSLFGDSFKEMKVLLGVTGLEENQEEGLRRWNKGLKIIKLCTRHGFKSFRFLRSVKMRIWRLLKTSRRNQLSEFSSANQAWKPGGTVSLNTSVWLEIYHRHGGKWKSKLVRLYAEAKSLRRSRLERAYCVGKIQEASRVTKRLRTERGKAILIAAVENCLSYCEGAASQNPNVDDNRVWNPGAVEVEGDKSCSSVIAEKLWNAENRKISVMDVHTNSENEVKWVVVLSVTLTLESQKSFSSPEYVITVQAFCFWSLEDKAAILSGSRLKFYGEKIEWICGVWDPGVAGYGQAKEVTGGIILMAKHDPIKYVVRVYKKRLRLRKVLAQVRKLDNLSLTEACKRTYAGISYTGVAVGDVWGIIAHIKKFLVIEKGFGVEFMGSRNYVTKGIWSCFLILVKFNILCHCVRNVCVSRSLRWVHVFKIYNEATRSIMDVKLTMESSGEHSVSVLTHELFHLPRPPELFCSLTLLKLQKMLKEFGVHLSSWSSYIPLLFIAKVLRLRGAEMSALGRGICGAVGFTGYKDVCTRPPCFRLRGAEISALDRGFAEELGLHFSSAMNSVSGLLASHTSLGDSPVAHPSFFPLSGETYEQE
ncbi:hypothetical protein YC2023_010819 [Brassica napus]